MEQHFKIADRDHVIVEHALIDDIGLLSYKKGLRIAQAMQPRDRLGRLPGRPRRLFRRPRPIGCAPPLADCSRPGITVVEWKTKRQQLIHKFSTRFPFSASK